MLIHFYKFIDKLRATPARKNKLIIAATAVGFAINVLIWALIYFKFYPAVYSLPEEQSFIPLHYNIYLGIDLFGHWQRIFILPGIGLFIFALNTILALALFNKKEIISYFLSVGAALIQIFLFIATLLTILINI